MSPLTAEFQQSMVRSSYAPHIFAGRVISLSDPPKDEGCEVAGPVDHLNGVMVAYRPGDALIPTAHHQTRLRKPPGTESTLRSPLVPCLLTRCVGMSRLSG